MRVKPVTIMIALLLIVAWSLGCITRQTPDGVIETRVDLDTTIAIAQLSLTTAEQALALWERYEAEKEGADLAALEREREQRVERIDRLRNVLADLYTLREKRIAAAAPS